MATKSGSTSVSKTVKKPETVTSDSPDEPLSSASAKSLVEAAHFNLLQISDVIQNRLGRLLREHDLTLSQYQVLRILDHANTSLPSLEIAARMPQVVPAITGLLTRLDEQGLVRRKQDKQDKRVTQVELTPKAKTLLKKLDKPVLNLHKELASSLNDADLKQFAKLLEKACQGVQTSTR